MKPEPLFFIKRDEIDVAGPYDLVQMAGLLRRKIITGDTPTREDGADHWQPFSWHPDFSVAREMSPDAVSKRVEESEARNAPPIPLPSKETVIKFAAAGVAIVIVFASSCLMARMSTDVGFGLAAVGAAVAVTAHAVIISRLWQGNYARPFLFCLIPGYELYTVAANLWKIWVPLFVRALGIAMVLGAIIGLRSRS